MFRRALSMCPINFAFMSCKVKKQESPEYYSVENSKTLGKKRAQKQEKGPKKRALARKRAQKYIRFKTKVIVIARTPWHP
jgi:hypothetical protein